MTWNPNEVTLLELLKHAAENNRAFHWISGRDPVRDIPTACIRLFGSDLDRLIQLVELDDAGKVGMGPNQMPYVLDDVVLNTSVSPGTVLLADHLIDMIAILFHGEIVGHVTRKEVDDLDGKIGPRVAEIVGAAGAYLRSVAGAVTQGPDLADIKKSGGRSFVSEGS